MSVLAMATLVESKIHIAPGTHKVQSVVVDLVLDESDLVSEVAFDLDGV